MMLSPAQQTAHLRLKKMRPVAELASRRPHGDHLRYIAGCRCDECRRANSVREQRYARLRKAGLGNPIVPADAARARLHELSAAGVGMASVVEATGISRAILCQIKSGKNRNLRRANEQKIFAVPLDYLADGAMVDAGPVWQLVRKTAREGGFTKRRIGQEVHGPHVRGLRIGKSRITVRTAERVRKACAALLAGGECLVSAARTRRLIASMLHDTLNDRRTVAREIGCAEEQLDVSKKRIPRAFAEAVERAYRIINE